MAPRTKVLVTGGAGYIGSHCVRMLLAGGHSVRVLDSLLWGDDALKPMMNGAGNLEVFQGDIRHVEDVVAATKGCQGVIHLAGIVGDPACELDPEATHTINFEATKIMVEVAKYANVRRFVFASTCSVYGAAEDYVLNEGSVVNPVSLYAETNLRSEHVILRGFEGTNTIPTIVRFATIYGVSSRMRFDLVVNIMSAKAHYERKVRVFGGDQWRPFVHVADAAGLSVVHVNRTIQTLRSRKILSKASHSIEVIDRKQLAQIGKFDGRYLNMSWLLSRWTVRLEEPPA